MKGLALIVWVLFSSIYLHYLSANVPKEYSLESYALFTFLLIGGGLSYDIAQKIYHLPKNSKGWLELALYMLIVFLGHIGVISGLFVTAILLNDYSKTVALLVGMSISLSYLAASCVAAYKSEKVFKKLAQAIS
ncbi:hypothetical protein ACHFJ9_16775 [Vibrio sp. D3]|uniref:hypothetical protein n=1 Tax=Vibrio sp. D3 TaxID=3374281 RepID=UPI003756A7DC